MTPSFQLFAPSPPPPPPSLPLPPIVVARRPFSVGERLVVVWDVRRARNDVYFRGSRGRTKNSRTLRADRPLSSTRRRSLARSLSLSLSIRRLRSRVRTLSCRVFGFSSFRNRIIVSSFRSSSTAQISATTTGSPTCMTGRALVRDIII